MAKYVLCCLGVFALSLPAWAGELDNEQTPARYVKVATKAAAPVQTNAAMGSELDKEAPQQSWRCHRCCWGCRRCCFSCYFGCAPVVCAYPTYCCYRPCYSAVYGGVYDW
jgi:hypothetical protein